MSKVAPMINLLELEWVGTGNLRDFVTVPTGYVYEILSIYLQYTTTANATPRTIALVLRKNNNTWYIVHSPVQVAGDGVSGAVHQYMFIPELSRESSSMTGSNITLVTAPRIVNQGTTIRVQDLAGVDVNDSMVIRGIFRVYDLP